MPRLDPQLPENWELIRALLNQILEAGEVTAIRQPIVADFLERVAVKAQLEAAGTLPKRFAMLGTPQKATLMACFAGQLLLWNRAHQDTELAIANHCRSEMTLLEQGYDKQTLAGTFWGKYRNLIRWLIQEKWLKISEINSFDMERPDDKSPRSESGQPLTQAEYFTEAYLKYDLVFYQEMKSATSRRNQEKIVNPRQVALLPLLQEYRRLLQSNELYDLAIAISGLTGRRFSEVIAKGQFAIAREYKLTFTGQLKTNDRSSFEIPTLFPAQSVLQAIERFRQLPEIASVQEESVKVLNNKFNPSINNKIFQLFQEKGLIIPLEGETKVTIHNLRALYGEIATHFFCPTRNQFPQFLDVNLGHVKTAGNLSNALSHYFRYQLVDESFKPIEAMGVKLSSLGDRFPAEVNNLLRSSHPYDQVLALVAATGLYPHELLGVGQLSQLSSHYFSYQPPLQRPEDLDRKIPLLGASDRLWELRQTLVKTLPELKESLTGRQLDEILETKARPALEQLGIPSFHALRLYHLDHSLDAIAEAQPKQREKVSQLRVYVSDKALFERYKGDRSQATLFSELLATFIQTRERNDSSQIEKLEQENLELSQRLQELNLLATQTQDLKIQNTQLHQQNRQLLSEKRSIEQERAQLQTQVEEMTQSHRELSERLAQLSLRTVQPVPANPDSLADLPPTPASPISNDFSQVLAGLQSLSAALQQWQGQNAPGGIPVTHPTSNVSPQSDLPTPALEIKSTPNAIAKPIPPTSPTQRDRDPLAFNFLEQQISTIIDRLMAFNDQCQYQTEKWYISLNLFRDADLTHSLKSLRQVFTHRKPELDAHHQVHGLNHRQNTRHDAQDFKRQFAYDWSHF